MSLTAFWGVVDNGYTKATLDSLNNVDAEITFDVTTGEGARLGDDFPCIVTIHDEAFPMENPFLDVDMEVAVGTLRVGDGVTLTRSDPKAHPGTPHVQILIMAAHLQQVHTAVNAIEAVNRVFGEELGGTKNGVNADFTFGQAPDTATERIFLEGLRLVRGTDYTMAGATATLLVNPLPTAESELTADYEWTTP